MQKDKTGPMSYTILKNQFRMELGLELKTWNHETPRRKHGNKAEVFGNDLLDMIPKTQAAT